MSTSSKPLRPGACAVPASTAVLRVTGEPARTRALLHRIRVGRVARHDHEGRGGRSRARREVSVEQRFVLLIVEAAADDHDVRGLVAQHRAQG